MNITTTIALSITKITTYVMAIVNITTQTINATIMVSHNITFTMISLQLYTLIFQYHYYKTFYWYPLFFSQFFFSFFNTITKDLLAEPYFPYSLPSISTPSSTKHYMSKVPIIVICKISTLPQLVMHTFLILTSL